jgi:lipoprotein-anchoring transpeptidase ErfK/SrfK
VDVQLNPWWYPPNSAWAAGEKPVPPGPGNPLGTRWMGINAPGVGMHGTPDDASIGYSASHGCIRMHIPDAEWLFEHVDVGTPVLIQ